MPRQLATAPVLFAFALLGSLGMPATAQVMSDSTFSWTGKIAGEGWLRVRDMRGDIRVVPGTGDQITVRGERRPGRRHEELVFEVETSGSDVTICARRADGKCSSRGWHDGDDDDYDRDDSRRPRADFTVSLPKGVRIDAVTGNGRIEMDHPGADVDATSGNGVVRVTGAGGPVSASSGNGEVTVDGAQGPVIASSGNGRILVNTSAGPVSATTGNGDVDVTMASLKSEARRDMEFTTGNGHVSVTVPPGFEGEVESSTGNGRVIADFPISVTGKFNGNHLRGTIGKGGPRIRLSTGNGNLELLKGSGA